jgi:hypothetical protein
MLYLEEIVSNSWASLFVIATLIIVFLIRWKLDSPKVNIIQPPVDIKERPSTTLYLFRYANDQEISLFELKYLDVPADAPPSDRFAWWWQNTRSGGKKKLGFKGMEPDKRFFQDGSVLDMTNLYYQDASGVSHAVICVKAP